MQCPTTIQILQDAYRVLKDGYRNNNVIYRYYLEWQLLIKLMFWPIWFLVAFIIMTLTVSLLEDKNWLNFENITLSI